ncbi:MAG TPA: lamin tail domain-containing protein, partial [Bacteroidia bacterium]|nr:lamin tail domain-containing protein [Bacteroidia bacterium]
MKKFLLAIISLGSTVFAHSQCNDLFISEYDEGTSNSKALEIYNPTPDSIDLSNYRLVRYSNGSSVGVDSIPVGPGYIH